MTHLVNEKIFKAYDIRGIYSDELNESSAYQIARGFAVYLIEKGDRPEKIIIGRDTRLSSPRLARSFMRGITDEGIDVWNIGETTSDMVYFASANWHLPSCMVTASHNPKDWNGFKLMAKDVELLSADSGLEDIKNLIRIKNWPELPDNHNIPEGTAIVKNGKITVQSIDNDFIRHVLSFVNLADLRPMRVVIDTGSGMVGPILKKVLEKLPLEYKALYFNPDGDFPYHEPNPILSANLGDLIGELKNNHYHFGCAFDGDGDRIVFVDEMGEAISPSIIGAIMARYFIKRSPRDKIVYGATVSRIVPETVLAYNGTAVRERVGHTFIKRKLQEIDGIFACESSGHYFFRKNFYADSAIIGFLVMLDILSSTKKSLSVLANEFGKYVSIPETNFKVKDPHNAVQEIAKYFEGYSVDFLDGMTVQTPDFWLNLRPSNTEPLLRLNIEAKDEATLYRVKNDITNIVKGLS